MNLAEIKSQWEQDSVIDDLDIGSESLKNSKLHSKYLGELVNYKMKLTQHKFDYKLLRQVKFRYYRGELSREELLKYELTQYQGPKHLKNEMGEILDGDQELIDICKKIEYCEIVISTLESIIKSIFSRGFDIKNHIEFEKFRSGF